LEWEEADMNLLPNIEFQGTDLWRRQCARNLMDCYALGMEAAMAAGEGQGRKCFEDLTRLMVEGMTAVRGTEDEDVFYRMASEQCRKCSMACGQTEKARLFRIYAAVFEDMSESGRES
jgi:hypothetical protein